MRQKSPLCAASQLLGNKATQIAPVLLKELRYRRRRRRHQRIDFGESLCNRRPGSAGIQQAGHTRVIHHGSLFRWKDLGELVVNDPPSKLASPPILNAVENREFVGGIG